MTPDEYWNGDPTLTKAYREAYRMRIEHENYMAWLTGLYVYNAVSVALHNAFSKAPVSYREEPLRILKPTQEELEMQAQKEREKATKFFEALQASFEAKQLEQEQSDNAEHHG